MVLDTSSQLAGGAGSFKVKVKINVAYEEVSALLAWLGKKRM